ncbi:hypothetical protein [Nocardioides sp. YIM 152315]|uniref:hypothetical protein n=1 Tax=Nocardioides sp. YIM 152315 TaxID=3031760 RepID=UPI0023D99C25|nr:hypothetical protein [Nocardioides sp. YIM 152315]MDF1603125.1 hypothetical protein [Nocardioides sp. YIM 152315]
MAEAASGHDDALDYRSAMTSPCDTCATSPCCTYLPLDNFEVHTLVDLDYAVFLLNFEDIELGVNRAGEWTSFYVRSCRHLTAEGRCGVHGTDEQPHVCQQYSAFNCWYRPALVAERGDHVRVDRARLQWILDRIEFGPDREIRALPTWEELSAHVAAEPLPRVGPTGAPHDSPKPFAEAPGPSDVVAPPGSPGLAILTAHEPCDGCAAYCCTTLLFPISPPDSMSHLDYLRFVLGFPNVTINVVDRVWRLAVRTRCRHLDGNRCGVFGEWDRPLRCSGYDAWQCSYVPSLGPQAVERPPRGVTLTADDFPLLADCLGYDVETGEVVDVPDLEGLAAALYVLRAERDALAAGRRQLPITPVG